MQADMELSLSQHFEIERFNRAIEATADADALRSLAKQLLQAWHTQQAATNWMISQNKERKRANPKVGDRVRSRRGESGKKWT